MRWSIVWGLSLWPLATLAGSPANELARYEPADVRLSRDATPAHVTLATAKGEIQLELWPHSLRAPDFQLLARDGGELRPISPEPPRTFVGHVIGETQSDVRASWAKDGLHAILRGPTGIRVVEPASLYGKPGGYVLYRPEDLVPVNAYCGTQDEQRMNKELLTSSERLPVPRNVRAPGIVELAIDTDVEYFQANGSDEQATMADIEMVLNAAEVQYQRDVDISFRVTAILVTKSEPDPYGSTDPSVLLSNELTPEWQLDKHRGIRRDVMHLFTGKDLNGGVIGIAWIGVVCGSFGTGLGQSRFSQSLPRRADLAAHEMGHNWSANHCDSLFGTCCGDPSFTMCSSLKQNVRNAFGGPDQTVIEGFRDQIQSCLTAPPRMDAGGPGSGPGWILGVFFAAVSLSWLASRRWSAARA